MRLSRTGWPEVYGELPGPMYVCFPFGLTALILFVFYKSRTLNVLALGTPDSHRPGRGCFRAVGDPFRGGYCHVQPLLCGGRRAELCGAGVPHLARRLVGPDYRVLLPATVLSGAVLMTFSDILSRTLLAPNENSCGHCGGGDRSALFSISADQNIKEESSMDAVLYRERHFCGLSAKHSSFRSMDVEIPRGCVTLLS